MVRLTCNQKNIIVIPVAAPDLEKDISPTFLIMHGSLNTGEAFSSKDFAG
jgi:hypothetical protein